MTVLTECNMDTIPPRYIRQDRDQPIIQNGVSAHEVPVIDMQRLLSQESMDSELAKLHYACKDWGFFQLVNHGVKSSLLEKIKKEVQDLFDLPMEEKKKLWQYPGEVEGFGQAFVVSEDQKLDWGDLFFLVTQPVEARKPHLFPNLPLPLRDTLDAYSSDVKNLAMAILAQMAKALEIEAEEMTEIFEDGFQSMRMNYYPPCPQPDKVIGLTSHSDASGLTILLQVNEVEGLQIKKDGQWVSIEPLPNAFVINIGDILEIISNGIYRSIEHRATVNLEKERISIATFYAPRYSAEMGPAPSLITKQTPGLFKRIGVEEYFRSLFSRELHGKSHLDTLRV
ncbi:hypothetical protein P3X46_026876 [Hevea brasiliensis]|uniref:Fe2OG dioxygenase domain-containing protein n=1 Tax=Hevea brasiliensis TaxID=3981 RepID=A0ABQ9KY26_HEVBR|nr:protein SRG1 isoform X2 [Hevea brasiliensis]XP_057992150.1 protein SRG1 isoform X2 [Hevea brasiliensis]KAJ9153437.1 hypothetical protein P3X46_026876 [Hevea brasiliensis]